MLQVTCSVLKLLGASPALPVLHPTCPSAQKYTRLAVAYACTLLEHPSYACEKPGITVRFPKQPDSSSSLRHVFPEKLSLLSVTLRCRWHFQWNCPRFSVVLSHAQPWQVSITKLRLHFSVWDQPEKHNDHQWVWFYFIFCRPFFWIFCFQWPNFDPTFLKKHFAAELNSP